jgi:hypothetical protein
MKTVVIAIVFAAIFVSIVALTQTAIDKWKSQR